jgi:hypothetical protein
LTSPFFPSRSFYPVEDPVASVGLLHRLSLLLGVHAESAVVVLDVGECVVAAGECPNANDLSLAGVASSTAYVYTFHRHVADGSFQISPEAKRLLLPGLFAAASSPAELQARVDDLLRAAEDLLPDSVRGKSSAPPPPILVKVSPRALETSDAKAVDDVVIALSKSLFASRAFDFRPESSLGTLGDAEETVLQWFSINLLRHRVKDFRPEATAVIVDVGDVDLKITFAVDGDFHPPESRKIEVRTFGAFGHLVKLVTLTLPGLGLLEARNNMLTFRGPSPANDSGGVERYRSGCMNPVVEADWSWAGRDFRVLGKAEPDFELIKERNGPFAGKKVNRPVANYEECHVAATAYLDAHLDAHVDANASAGVRELLRGRETFMSGLLLEKCLERGLTLPYRGGDVRLKSFVDSLVHACKVPNAEQPFGCVDLMYLATVLDRLFGMKQGSVLRASCDVDGRRGEWPLAAALHVYENGL